jgi:hypothetical protein
MAGFREQAHGRYLVKTGPRGTLWQARAYIGDQLIGDIQVAATAEQALASLLSDLDARDSLIHAGRGADGSPSAIEYVEAFDRLGGLPTSYEAMLEAHLNAPDHLISASHLAAAAGYTNWSAANLHYGTLGRRLAEQLNYNPPTRPDGSVIWTYALAIAPGDGDLDSEQIYAALERSLDDPHFEWLLRPQVVEALRGRSVG